MKTIIVALAVSLVLAAPAAASDKATIAKLRHQVAAMRTTIHKVTGQRDQAAAQLVAANSKVTNLQTALQGSVDQQLVAETPDQLWHSIGSIAAIFPNVSGCGYSQTFYTSGGYTSHDFTQFIC